ncbi:MAG: hypothetical protein KatS3mg045_1921 [Bellilinea sp.]|nr:MAG: hypothetical protein KatS3mg045_1921 [Bellilinea sp.]
MIYLIELSHNTVSINEEGPYVSPLLFSKELRPLACEIFELSRQGFVEINASYRVLHMLYEAHTNVDIDEIVSLISQKEGAQPHAIMNEYVWDTGTTSINLICQSPVRLMIRISNISDYVKEMRALSDFVAGLFDKRKTDLRPYHVEIESGVVTAYTFCRDDMREYVYTGSQMNDFPEEIRPFIVPILKYAAQIKIGTITTTESHIEINMPAYRKICRHRAIMEEKARTLDPRATVQVAEKNQVMWFKITREHMTAEITLDAPNMASILITTPRSRDVSNTCLFAIDLLDVILDPPCPFVPEKPAAWAAYIAKESNTLRAYYDFRNVRSESPDILPEKTRATAEQFLGLLQKYSVPDVRVCLRRTSYHHEVEFECTAQAGEEIQIALRDLAAEELNVWLEPDRAYVYFTMRDHERALALARRTLDLLETNLLDLI